MHLCLTLILVLLRRFDARCFGSRSPLFGFDCDCEFLSALDLLLGSRSHSHFILILTALQVLAIKQPQSHHFGFRLTLELAVTVAKIKSECRS